MGFFDDIERHFNLIAAVEISKNADGIPDPYAATGIAFGLNENISNSEISLLGVLLGAEGAFDSVGKSKKPTSSKAINTDIDLHGSIPPQQHCMKMRTILEYLADNSDGREEIDIELSFELFIAGTLYDIVKKTKLNVREQIKMLEDAIEISNVQVRFSAKDIVDDIQAAGPISQAISILTSPYTQNFWRILVIMGSKAGSDGKVLDFLKEYSGFVMGVAIMLMKKYPNINTREIAAVNTIEILNHWERQRKGEF